MPAFTDDKNRHIIPRWRSLWRTASLEELSSISPAPAPTAPPALSTKLADFRLHPSASFAADLVATAFMAGKIEEVRTAVDTLQRDDRAELAVARSLLDYSVRARGGRSTVVDGAGLFSRADIAGLKASTRLYCRNSLAWSDLALAYETLGFTQQASRAMAIALQLAPRDRYVLRCASRMYNHHDDYIRAQQVLLESGMAQADPWIMAAEIAAASIVGKTSQFAKKAKTKVEQHAHAPKHLSELASAIATLEMTHGKLKNARRLFEVSLAEPTENAIAQASWAARHATELNTAILHQEIEHSAEARAWMSMKKGDWEQSLREAERWLLDQPFSSRPAIHGSYIAAVAMMDYSTSCRLCRQGLIANTHSFGLLNNLTYAEAQLGHIDDAEKVFGQIEPEQLDDVQRIVWTATRGLLLYRRGRSENGRGMYRDAMELARKLHDDYRLALAASHLALEELAANDSHAGESAKFAMTISSKLDIPDVKCLSERVRKLVGENRK